MSADLGESLVGAYLRQVAGCNVVTFNTFTGVGQGEIDVIGLAGGDQPVAYLCEVTMHLDGLLIGRSGAASTAKKVDDKLRRADAFARATFPTHSHRIEYWSPRIREGLTLNAVRAVVDNLAAEGIAASLVANETFTSRVNVLVQLARRTTSPSPDPAFRFLQVLTHLRGGRPQL